MPVDVKLLPGQLLGIRQTVREAHPPPLPHRPPLPSFDNLNTTADSGTQLQPAGVYAHIDDCDSDDDDDDDEEQAAAAAATEGADADRLNTLSVFASDMRQISTNNTYYS